MLSAGVPREQLFFTSKVPPKSINYEAAKQCVDESLSKTGLDYIGMMALSIRPVSFLRPLPLKA